MRKSKGFRTRTRSLLRKKPREKGKLKTTKILKKYNSGDKVVIKIDSAISKGMPHKRYHGNIGVVEGKRGRSYKILINLGKAKKEIIVRPEHLEMYLG